VVSSSQSNDMMGASLRGRSENNFTAHIFQIHSHVIVLLSHYFSP